MSFVTLLTLLTLLIAIFVLVSCIAAAVVLMRRSDLKNATAVQAEAEKLLAQANREVKKTRRVRAGTQGYTT
jgi:uncharacterized membrane protein